MIQPCLNLVLLQEYNRFPRCLYHSSKAGFPLMKGDSPPFDNYFPALDTREVRKNRLSFFSSRFLSSSRSFNRAPVSEDPSLKMPQKCLIGSSGRGAISTRWSFTILKKIFCPGFTPRASLISLGMTNCPFDDKVTIGIV